MRPEWRSIVPVSQIPGSEQGAVLLQWYVMQTWTGKEEQLVEMVRRIVPRECYGDCFVAYYERLFWRQQKNLIHVERSFPGYVFITCDDPDGLFFSLKNVPSMSKIIGDGNFTFLPLDPNEASFLSEVMDEDHVMRLSYVSTDGKNHVRQISGPLKTCEEKIVRWRFRERYVNVNLKLLGKEKNVMLGIVLNEDIRRELLYGKVEAPIMVPEHYILPFVGTDAAGKAAEFSAGDPVTVVDGSFVGMPAVIYQVKRNTVKIGVRLFGQDMAVEVPIGTVRKTVA